VKNIQKILNAILNKHIFEYILIDRDFKIEDFSSEADILLSHSIHKSDDIFEYLPELIGYEDTIDDIFEGKIESDSLMTISKGDRYLNLYLDYYDDKRLLILLQDITELTKEKHKTLQYSNQTTLLNNTLEKIIHGQNSIILLTDSKDKIIFANDKFSKQCKLNSDIPLYKLIDNSISSFRELHERVNNGLDQIKLRDRFFIIESKMIDSSIFLFTLFELTKIIEKKERLQDEINRDPLTGVYRKKIADERVEKLLKSNEFFGLSVVDIDNFKQINDTYGHIYGDTILKEFATLLKSHLTEDDLIARWGGEEFILIFTEKSQDEIIEYCNSLCKIVAEHTFSENRHITASFGLTVSSKSDTLSTILSRADKALYRAKGEGKNRVVFIPPYD